MPGRARVRSLVRTRGPEYGVGMHRVAFSVDDLDEALEIAARHGCHPLRGVATSADTDRLTDVRGPSGIIVLLAEDLRQAWCQVTGGRRLDDG